MLNGCFIIVVVVVVVAQFLNFFPKLFSCFLRSSSLCPAILALLSSFLSSIPNTNFFQSFCIALEFAAVKMRLLLVVLLLFFHQRFSLFHCNDFGSHLPF